MTQNEASGGISAPDRDFTFVSPKFVGKRYRILQELGRGSYGVVSCARDENLLRQVAIKIFYPKFTSAKEVVFREAQALAQFHDPDIVTIHDVGRDADYWYIVMEYLQGDDLAGRLRDPQEKFDVRRVLWIGRAVARALAAAHEKRVLHLDVKPSNVFVENGDRSCKLLDFGVALLRAPSAPTRQSGAVAIVAARPSMTAEPTPNFSSRGIVGTAAYAAPEVFAKGEPNEAWDIWSAGALLFRLLTGRPPVDLKSRNEISEFHASGALVPRLAELRPDLPRALVEVVDQCLARDPSKRGSAQDLLHKLTAAVPRARSTLPEAPYVGLEHMGPRERGVFFGRDRDIDSIISALRRSALICLVGGPGAGKSSLARAGVGPLVEDGELDRSRRWRVAVARPELEPISGFAKSIAQTLNLDAGALEKTLRDSAKRPTWWTELSLSQHVPGAARTGLLIIVDQLEELFTSSREEDDPILSEEARILAEAIGWVGRHQPKGLRILTTLQHDYLDRLVEVEPLRDSMSNHTILVRPLSGPELTESIVEPARALGYELDPEIALELVKELEGKPNAMLLLSFALRELWTRRNETTKKIPLTAWNEIGKSARQALAGHAAGTVGKLISNYGESAVRAVMLGLVGFQRTRRLRQVSDLIKESPAPESVTSILGELAASQNRLVVFQGALRENVELADDVLIEKCPQLHGWLEADKKRRQLLGELEHAAREWDRGRRPAHLLWSQRGRVADLREASKASDLDPTTTAFVGASLARRRHLTRIDLASIVGVLALVAGVSATSAVGVEPRGNTSVRVGVYATPGPAQSAALFVQSVLNGIEGVTASTHTLNASVDGWNALASSSCGRREVAAGAAADCIDFAVLTLTETDPEPADVRTIVPLYESALQVVTATTTVSSWDELIERKAQIKLGVPKRTKASFARSLRLFGQAHKFEDLGFRSPLEYDDYRDALGALACAVPTSTTVVPTCEHVDVAILWGDECPAELLQAAKGRSHWRRIAPARAESDRLKIVLPENDSCVAGEGMLAVGPVVLATHAALPFTDDQLKLLKERLAQSSDIVGKLTGGRPLVDKDLEKAQLKEHKWSAVLFDAYRATRTERERRNEELMRNVAIMLGASVLIVLSWRFFRRKLVDEQ